MRGICLLLGSALALTVVTEACHPPANRSPGDQTASLTGASLQGRLVLPEELAAGVDFSSFKVQAVGTSVEATLTSDGQFHLDQLPTGKRLRLRATSTALPEWELSAVTDLPDRPTLQVLELNLATTVFDRLLRHKDLLGGLLADACVNVLYEDPEVQRMLADLEQALSNILLQARHQDALGLKNGQEALLMRLDLALARLQELISERPQWQRSCHALGQAPSPTSAPPSDVAAPCTQATGLPPMQIRPSAIGPLVPPLAPPIPSKPQVTQITEGSAIGGVAVSPSGAIYFTEEFEKQVWRLDPAGSLTLALGSSINEDGSMSNLDILREQPKNLAFDQTGNLLISVWNGEHVVRLNHDGTTTTVAGGGNWGDYQEGGSATQAYLPYPGGLAFDREGNLFVAAYDRIRRIDPHGKITTFAGGCGVGYSGDGGPARLARLEHAGDLVFDGQGNLYVHDGNNHAIRKIDRHGIITTWLPYGGPLAADAAGNVFFVYQYQDIGVLFQVDANRNLNTVLDLHEVVDRVQIGSMPPHLPSVTALAFGPQGDLYLAFQHAIFKLTF